MTQVVDDLSHLLISEMRTIITGDCNFDKKEVNAMTVLLKDSKFTQVVTWPTHTQGRTLDHCYVSENTKVIAINHQGGARGHAFPLNKTPNFKILACARNELPFPFPCFRAKDGEVPLWKRNRVCATSALITITSISIDQYNMLPAMSESLNERFCKSRQGNKAKIFSTG